MVGASAFPRDVATWLWPRAPAGTWVQITATDHTRRTARVHDLTVDGVHTYYALAGRTQLLVHNEDGCGTAAGQGTRGPKGDFQPQVTVQKAPDNWDLNTQISEATGLRGELARAATGKAKSRTWTGAVNTRTGDVAVSCSGAGSCAEPNILELTGWNARDVIFTRAVRREDIGDGLGKILQEKEICPVCQGLYPPENFVSGVLSAPEGPWNRRRP